MNLLGTPGFEVDSNGNGLADDWLPEHTVSSPPPTFSRVATTVEGSWAQRMQWDGTAAPSGSNKVEFYQATAIGSFVAGDPATFEVWLSGSVTGGGYCQIVVEGHTGSTYLDEVQQVVELGPDLQPYRLVYPSLPAGTDSVVVVVMAVELTDSSVVDVTADLASVVKEALGPIVRGRQNEVLAPRFVLEANPPTGWSEATSGPVQDTYNQTGVGLRWVCTGATSGTANQAQLISNSFTVAAGQVVTASMDVTGTLTGCNLILRWQFIGTGGSTVDTTALTPGGRVSHSATSPIAGTARLLVRVTAIGTTDAFDLTVDRVLLEKVATAGVYFDGDSDGFGWRGTAHNSASWELIAPPVEEPEPVAPVIESPLSLVVTATRTEAAAAASGTVAAVADGRTWVEVSG